MDSLEPNPMYDSSPVYEQIIEPAGIKVFTRVTTPDAPAEAVKVKREGEGRKWCLVSFVFSVLVSSGVAASLVFLLCTQRSGGSSFRCGERSCAKDNGDCEDTCWASLSGVQCSCSALGLTLSANNRTCRDIDECLANPCAGGSTCLNTLGSFHCLAPDEDECLTDPCEAGATCLNTVGGYHCLSADVNECLVADTCPEGFTCLNTVGSYYCLERNHWNHSHHSCVSNPCASGSTCLITEKGFYCLEPPLDECLSNPCIEGATCVNTIGSHVCLEAPASGGGGAIFVRWGESRCPPTYGMERVYAGTMAGQYRGHSGGGATYVCLADTPEWGNYTDNRRATWRSYLHGAEYQIDGAGIFPFTASTQHLSSLNDQDVPCAVCRAATRASFVMIPGRRSCPAAAIAADTAAAAWWTLEYRGFLMAQKNGDQAAGQYVCVDEAPVAAFSGSRNAEGATVTFTAVRCGAIMCPPFVDYRELTCVVCTK